MYIIYFFALFAKTNSLGLRNIKPLNPQYRDVVQVSGSTFDLKPHTNFGNCSCDVSSNCDPYCCCDPDCAGVSFPYCLDSESTPFALRMCSDHANEGGGKVIEWFLRTSLCIQKNNNPSPGDFYDINIDFNEDDPVESNPSSLQNVFLEDSSSSSSSNVITRPFQEVDEILIPRRKSDGSCEPKNLVYLESVDEFCGLYNKNERLLNFTSFGSCNNNVTCIKNWVYKEFPNPNPNPLEYLHIIVKWGERSQNMSPTGYHFGEVITNETGGDLLFGERCISDNWKNFKINFGMQTDIHCMITEDDGYIFINGTDDRGNNVTYLNFSDTTILYDNKYYSISPFVNGLEDNVGTIRQETPDPIIIPENETVIITQSFTIIYKSIGPKENPQHIISDFKVDYFTSKATNLSLRMIVRYYEQPNELNIFDEPSMSDVYQWLPF